MNDGVDRRLELEVGRERVPLRYVEEAGAIFLLASDRASVWPVALLRAGRAAVVVGGLREERRADLVADPDERARIVGRFRAECGEARFGEWFPRPGRLIRLSGTGAGGAPDEPGAFDRWLRSEFDAAAPEYAEQVARDPVEAYLRVRSLAVLRLRLARHRRLLELGSGPGVETLPLLRDGHEVVAVDVSDGMLERLRHTARSEGLAERLTTVRMRLKELETFSGEGPVDAAYSTFGALNLEPDLSPVRRALGRLLPPGAPFVAGAFNRLPALEMLGYASVARWDRALARLRSPTPVGRSRFAVDFFPLSPSALARALRPDFRLSGLEGLGIAVPPPDLYRRLEGRWSLARMESLDRWLGARWPFRGLGDHFVATLTRGVPPAGEPPRGAR